MTEISQERIERFWKWCGVSLKHEWDDEICGYKTNGYFCTRCHAVDEYTDDTEPCLIPIDLNNLFKWAVPKVLEKIGGESLVALVNNALCDAMEAKGDVQDYLFLLIEKLIEEE